MFFKMLLDNKHEKYAQELVLADLFIYIGSNNVLDIMVSR